MSIEVCKCPVGKGKKSYKILQRKIVPNTNLWKVEFSTGGILPKELRTYWISVLELEKAVKEYVKSLEDRIERQKRWSKHSRYFRWNKGKQWRKQLMYKITSLL